MVIVIGLALILIKVPRELYPPKKFYHYRKRIVGQNLVYEPDYSDKISKFLDMNQIGQMNQGQIQIHSCQVENKILSRFGCSSPVHPENAKEKARQYHIRYSMITGEQEGPGE